MTLSSGNLSPFTPQNAADLAKATLLVVDNKPLFRDMVRSAFLTKVRGVREATSIEKAVEILTRNGAGISCVICDWDINPTGGLELLRMIRARAIPGVSPDMPVVILTSRAEPNAVKTAMDLDVNGFAVTPLSFAKLVGTVCSAMTRTWQLQAAGSYVSVRGVVPCAPPVEKVGLQKVRLDKVPFVKVAAPKTAPKVATPFTGRAYSRRGEGPMMKIEPRPELKNVRMCILDDVSPGVVLAKDLRDREGHMLAASGTELKPTVLAHLKNVGYALADSYCVWVGER